MEVKRLKIKRAKVLIVDDLLSEYLKYSIPTNISYATVPLPSRGVIPWILRFNFFVSLFKRVAKYGFTSNSFLLSTIDVINPHVIITYVDNNQIMGELAEIFKDKLVISVQNGIRLKNNKSINFNKIPVYYGFGDYERDLYKELGITNINYIPVGSYRMGVFLSKKNRNITYRKDSICLISQFRKIDKNLSSNITSIVFSDLQKFSSVYGYKVEVLMTYEENSMHFRDEFDFFSKQVFYKDVSLIPNNYKNMISYNIGYSSNIIISLHSTLGFELFGCGKKVLFYFPLVSKVDKNMEEYKNKIPSYLLYEDCTNKEEFYKKMNFLLSVDENTYLSMCKKSMNYVMKCQNEYPHIIIKRRIEKFLTKINTSS
jgi:surface carbohydrate biosynthesis protein